MKKRLALLLALFMLLTCIPLTAMAEEPPETELENSIALLEETHQQAEVLSADTYYPYTHFFPDPYLAQEVARWSNTGDTKDDLTTALRLSYIRTLYIWDEKVENLEGLEYLTGVTKLWVWKPQNIVSLEPIGDLANLRSLTLQILGNDELPESFTNLKKLESLDVIDMPVVQIPEWITELTALKAFNWSLTDTAEIPEEMGSMATLEYFRMYKSQVASIPDALCNLPQLTELEVSHCPLTALPDSIGNLTNLEKLSVNNTSISVVPDSIGNLTKLSRLQLEHNRLTEIPDTIGNLADLTLMYLHENQLTMLPETIGNLTKLETLYIQNNEIASFPESIGNMASLDFFPAGNNKLTTLPDSIGNLAKLEYFDAGNNQLTSLPDSIGNLTALTRLSLYGNQLSALPESLGNLTDLQWLTITDNQFTELPAFITQMTNTYIYVDGNQLTELPDGFFSELPWPNAGRQTATTAMKTFDTNELTADDLYPALLKDVHTHEGFSAGWNTALYSWEIYDESAETLLYTIQSDSDSLTLEDGKYTVMLKSKCKGNGHEGEYNRDCPADSSSSTHAHHYKIPVTISTGSGEPQDYSVNVMGYGTSSTGEYMVNIVGNIQGTFTEGANVLSYADVQIQNLSINTFNLTNGASRVMGISTVEGVTVTVTNGAVTNVEVKGRAQTNPGNFDRYTVNCNAF